MTASQKTLCGISNNLPANPMPLFKLVSKENLLQDIWQYGGCTTLLAKKYDVSYKQVYNALDHYKLRDELKAAKEAFLDKAAGVIFKALDSDNEAIALKAAEAALRYNLPLIAQQINISPESKLVEIKQIFGAT